VIKWIALLYYDILFGFFFVLNFFGRVLNKDNWFHIVSMSVWCIGSDACQMLVCEALGSHHVSGLTFTSLIGTHRNPIGLAIGFL
jgi:hypothetical protein